LSPILRSRKATEMNSDSLFAQCKQARWMGRVYVGIKGQIVGKDVSCLSVCLAQSKQEAVNRANAILINCQIHKDTRTYKTTKWGMVGGSAFLIHKLNRNLENRENKKPNY